MNTEDDTVASLSSAFHFQFFESDIQIILDCLRDESSFTITEGPYSITLDFTNDSFGGELLIDVYADAE